MPPPTTIGYCCRRSLYIRIVCLSVRPLTPISHYLVEAVWRSGSALVSINVVKLRRARLVLGWVTVGDFSFLLAYSVSGVPKGGVDYGG